MKRRKFLLTSGTALLGSTAVSSITQEPAVALNFDLVGVENAQPSNTDTILVDFQNFELIPKYINENAEDATITITLNIEGYDSTQTQSKVSLTNGQAVSASDLDSAVPIVQDNINSSQTALDGSINISIDHQDVSDSYDQSFTITDDSLQQGLVGYWPLHEWSGRANDLSTFGNHGSLNGGVSQGVWGRGGLTSYSFDGSDDYVSIPDDDSAFDFGSSDFCVSVWCKIDSFPSFTDPIVEQFNSGGNRAWTLRVKDGRLVFSTTADGTTQENMVTDNMVVQEKKWHHVVVNKSGTNADIYVDGDVKSDGGSAVAGDIYNSSEDIRIATKLDASNFVNMSAGDLRIYDRTLTPDEIQSIYNFGNTDYTTSSLHDGSDSGAISRWRFNSGEVTRDEWNDNSLTDNTDSGTTIDAVNGDAKIFDGNDDYLTTSATFFDTDTWSISVWFKTSKEDNFNTIINTNSSSPLVEIATTNNSRNNTVYSRVFDSNGDDLSVLGVGRNVETNDWYHATAVRNGSELSFYINGTKTKSDLNTEVDSDISGSPDIGRKTDGTNSFQGEIDDLRIYNRALSTDEVQELYQWGTRGQDLRDRTTTKNKNDMLGWWKLNETNGSTAYDSSGNGNDGTVNGANVGGATNTALNQSAYDFDGQNDYINIRNFGSKNQSLTVSGWINIDGNSTNHNLFGRYDGSDDILQLTTTSGDPCAVKWNIGHVGNAHRIKAGKVPTDIWTHISATYDSVNQNSILYVNGSKVGSDNSTLADFTTTGDTWIGARSDGNIYFDGQISDVRLYKRVLTPQEISYLYEQKY